MSEGDGVSEWTPKVGDKVMVGEHGPYRVTWVSRQGELASLSDADGRITYNIPCYWLTPAPEAEPDEPTAPGALVRDGDGVLWAKADKDLLWLCLTKWRSPTPWNYIGRPITVVLADPAEVEQLRADLRALGVEYDRVIAERDRFAERIDELERDYESAASERDEAKEAASHATVNADRFASQADSLRARLKMAWRDRDIERRLGSEEKRRADELQGRIDKAMTVEVRRDYVLQAVHEIVAALQGEES